MGAPGNIGSLHNLQSNAGGGSRLGQSFGEQWVDTVGAIVKIDQTAVAAIASGCDHTFRQGIAPIKLRPLEYQCRVDVGLDQPAALLAADEVDAYELDDGVVARCIVPVGPVAPRLRDAPREVDDEVGLIKAGAGQNGGQRPAAATPTGEPRRDPPCGG